MAIVNKYIYNAHISEGKFRDILRYFSVDLEATQISKLVHISRPTVNKYINAIRKRIADYSEKMSPFSGIVEIDESYFGGRRIKGKRGRGARGKTIVFGIFERGGQVYTEIIPDCKMDTIRKIIRGKVKIDTIINTDSWRGYNGLVDVGYSKHFRVKHGENEFAKGNCHINGIESFWSYAKMRLVKFRGINHRTYYLHLKECEFRFNHRKEIIYKLLLNMFRFEPLKLS